MDFLEWKCLNFAQGFTEVCSWGSNHQNLGICSDNGLKSTRRQAIIWINMASLLTHICVTRPQWVDKSIGSRSLENLRKWSGASAKARKCHWSYRVHGEFHLVPELTHWGHETSVNASSLVQAVDCRLPGAKPLPEPMLYLNVNWARWKKLLWNCIQHISFTKIFLKISTALWRPFCRGPNVLIWVL